MKKYTFPKWSAILCSITVLILIASSQSAAQNHQLEIQRKSITEQCIMGYLVLDGEVLCYTLELPYIGNINGISSIPAGEYKGFIREDGSKGWRIELTEVPDRTNIQVHVGNYTKDIIGCTLVGIGADVNNCTVTQSQAARNILREKLGPLVNSNIQVVYSQQD